MHATNKARRPGPGPASRPIPTPADHDDNRAKLRLFTGLILGAAVLAVYGQAIGFGTVWDDSVHLSHPILARFDATTLRGLWQGAYEGLYIPVSYLLLGAVGALAEFAGLARAEPSVLHALALALHTINAFLVLRLLRRLSLGMWPALGGALLFALHPLQVESVVWIAEIRGLLAFGLGSAALLAALTAESRPGRWGQAPALVLFCLAMLAKPTAVVMPLFYILIATLGLHGSLGTAIRRAAGFLLLAVVLGAVTAWVQGYNPSIRTPEIPSASGRWSGWMPWRSISTSWSGRSTWRSAMVEPRPSPWDSRPSGWSGSCLRAWP